MKLGSLASGAVSGYPRNMTYKVKFDDAGNTRSTPLSAQDANALAQDLVMQGKINVRVVGSDGNEWSAQEFKNIGGAVSVRSI